MKSAEEYAKKYLDKELLEIQRSERYSELPALTFYEKAIIYKYSNDGYESLNEKIRLNAGNNDSEFGVLLDSALLKLPDFGGLVYRGANLTLSEISKYASVIEHTGLISESTFISTSKSSLIASQFRGNTLFQIYSRTRKEIEKIAKFGTYSYANEKEVLLRPNRHFVVLEVVVQETFTFISIEEV